MGVSSGTLSYSAGASSSLRTFLQGTGGRRLPTRSHKSIRRPRKLPATRRGSGRRGSYCRAARARQQAVLLRQQRGSVGRRFGCSAVAAARDGGVRCRETLVAERSARCRAVGRRSAFHRVVGRLRAVVPRLRFGARPDRFLDRHELDCRLGDRPRLSRGRRLAFLETRDSPQIAVYSSHAAHPNRDLGDPAGVSKAIGILPRKLGDFQIHGLIVPPRGEQGGETWWFQHSVATEYGRWNAAFQQWLSTGPWICAGVARAILAAWHYLRLGASMPQRRFPAAIAGPACWNMLELYWDLVVLQDIHISILKGNHMDISEGVYCSKIYRQ